MRKHFSIKWKASKQPRKQRKYRTNAPLHVRRKMMSINLSKELRKKYGKRNFPVRNGDNVMIMRGEFKGKTGKINLVNYKKKIVIIDMIYRTKIDKTKISVKFDPSNLQIKELNLDDKNRKDALERKANIVKDKKKSKKELNKNAS